MGVPMKKMQKFIALILAFSMCLLMTASMFKTTEMALDTTKNIVYQNENLEYFLIRRAASQDSAKAIYQNGYYVFLGTIRSKNSDNKKLTLGELNDSSLDVLSCSVTNADVRRSLSDISVGNTVKAYGKLNVGILDGEWELVIDRIEKTQETELSRTAYSLLNGTTLDTEKMIKRSLAVKDGHVDYLIPKDWQGVEKNIVLSGLGTMEGYQYCLNEIGNQSVHPESLFVCYFENEKHLLRSSDKNETDLIEKAIVKNILKKDLASSFTKVQTYYGASYHYYQDAYRTALGQNYHAEFVFQPDGTRGMVVYLYVYREKSHLDQVMMAMRLLTVD